MPRGLVPNKWAPERKTQLELRNSLIIKKKTLGEVLYAATRGSRSSRSTGKNREARGQKLCTWLVIGAEHHADDEVPAAAGAESGFGVGAAVLLCCCAALLLCFVGLQSLSCASSCGRAGIISRSGR